MAFRFRKSKKIMPGLRLSLGKKSASVRVGPKGAGVSKSTSGRRTVSAGIPGSGLGVQETTSKKKDAAEAPEDNVAYQQAKPDESGHLLRPAELFVLERDDVDQEREEIRISRSLGSGGEVTLPKNGKPRTVVLPPPAREALVSFPRRVDVPWLFTSKTGTRLSKTSHYYLWNRVRDVAGRPGMDFYELRHFFATYLLEQGLSPADVSIQLGHTDGGALE